MACSVSTECHFHLLIPVMPDLNLSPSRSQHPLCQIGWISDKGYGRNLKNSWNIRFGCSEICVLDTVGKTHSSNGLCLHHHRSLKTYLLSLCKTRMQQLPSSVWEKLIFNLSNCLLLQGQLYLFIFYPASFQKRFWGERRNWTARVSEKETGNDILQFDTIFWNNVKPLQGWENS